MNLVIAFTNQIPAYTFEEGDIQENQMPKTSIA